MKIDFSISIISKEELRLLIQIELNFNLQECLTRRDENYTQKAWSKGPSATFLLRVNLQLPKALIIPSFSLQRMYIRRSSTAEHRKRHSADLSIVVHDPTPLCRYKSSNPLETNASLRQLQSLSGEE